MGPSAQVRAASRSVRSHGGGGGATSRATRSRKRATGTTATTISARSRTCRTPPATRARRSAPGNSSSALFGARSAIPSSSVQVRRRRARPTELLAVCVMRRGQRDQDHRSSLQRGRYRCALSDGLPVRALALTPIALCLCSTSRSWSACCQSSAGRAPRTRSVAAPRVSSATKTSAFMTGRAANRVSNKHSGLVVATAPKVKPCCCSQMSTTWASRGTGSTSRAHLPSPTLAAERSSMFRRHRAQNSAGRASRNATAAPPARGRIGRRSSHRTSRRRRDGALAMCRRSQADLWLTSRHSAFTSALEARMPLGIPPPTPGQRCSDAVSWR